MPNRCCIPDRHYAALRAISLVLARQHTEIFPLSSALSVFAEQRTLKRHRTPLRRIALELKKGRSVAEAFSPYARHFGSFFLQALLFGEQAGNSEAYFSRLAEYYGRNDRFRRRIVTAIKYPAVIMAVATGALLSLLAIIIPPAVQAVLSNPGNVPALPWIVSHALALKPEELITPLILVLMLISCAFYMNIKYPWLEKALFVTPFIGSFSRKIALRRCALSLSFLLSNGVNIGAAASAVAQTVRHTPFRTILLRTAAESDKNGTNPSSRLQGLSAMFPQSTLGTFLNVQSIIDGGKHLERTAGFYEEEIVTSVTAAVLIIEPAVIAVAGLLGGGILAALYLPLH